MHDERVTEIWHTGDIVGYGARPNEVIKLLKSRGAMGISGNHDAEAIDEYGTGAAFNPEARAAILWTKRQLTSESWNWLNELRPIAVRKIGDERVLLAHGSPRSPHAEYLSPMGAHDAFQALKEFGADFGLYGHTHVPAEIFLRPKSVEPQRDVWYDSYSGYSLYTESDLRPNLPSAAAAGAWINAGSVGQPRDGDPRASWLLLTTEKSGLAHRRLFRTEYDIKGAKQDIMQAGLPAQLASRLDRGA
jgi:diadenosine tetraphosphatase ApaH/serine/threonine PP2A family protein phosphatase